MRTSIDHKALGDLKNDSISDPSSAGAGAQEGEGCPCSSCPRPLRETSHRRGWLQSFQDRRWQTMPFDCADPEQGMSDGLNMCRGRLRGGGDSRSGLEW